MRIPLLALASALILALAGCETTGLTNDQRLVGGTLGGAAAGLIAADVLEADDDWRLISALGGAAAGALVARNTQTQRCAYSRGDGTYNVAPCPT